MGLHSAASYAGSRECRRPSRLRGGRLAEACYKYAAPDGAKKILGGSDRLGDYYPGGFHGINAVETRPLGKDEEKLSAERLHAVR